jgi:hypothetical protein
MCFSKLFFLINAFENEIPILISKTANRNHKQPRTGHRIPTFEGKTRKEAQLFLKSGSNDMSNCLLFWIVIKSKIKVEVANPFSARLAEC